MPTQRASWTVVAAAGSGPDLAVKRLERDVKGMGFAQVGPGTAPFSLAVSGVRQGGGGSIVFKVSVFESPGGR